MEETSLWNIVLIGFMASGKTTVGRMLAGKMGRDFVDLDQMIERVEGISISEIFAEKGEGYFRGLEARMIEEVSDQEGLIIAVGGGAVMRHDNVEKLKNGGILYLLGVDAEEVMRRVGEDITRPLLEGVDKGGKVVELLAKRQAVYEEVADHEVDTRGQTPGEVVEEIERDFRLRVQTMS